MSAGPTRVQAKALRFIAGYIQRNGYSPTMREIAVGIDTEECSKGNAHRLVKAMAARGLITYTPGWYRSIRIIGDPAMTLVLPPELDRAVRALAAKASVDPVDIVIEIVCDRLAPSSSRSESVSCETSPSVSPCRLPA